MMKDNCPKVIPREIQGTIVFEDIDFAMIEGEQELFAGIVQQEIANFIGMPKERIEIIDVFAGSVHVVYKVLIAGDENMALRMEQLHTAINGSNFVVSHGDHRMTATAVVNVEVQYITLEPIDSEEEDSGEYEDRDDKKKDNKFEKKMFILIITCVIAFFAIAVIIGGLALLCMRQKRTEEKMDKEAARTNEAFSNQEYIDIRNGKTPL